jgi:MFS family permease
MNPPSEPLFSRSFVRLLMVQPLAGFAVSSFFLLPKFLATELHASAWDIGVVSASYGVAGALAIPFLARAIDRFSPRLLLLAGFAVIAVSAGGFVWVDRVGPLALVLRLGQGVAWAVMFTAGMMLTISLSPPLRLVQAIGYYGVATLVMNAIAPATAEILAEKAGWKPIFVLAALAGCLGFAFSLGLPDDRPRSAETVGTWRLLRRPATVLMVGIVAVWGLAFGAMFVFHQPYAIALGIRNVRGFFIAYTAAAVLSRAATGNVVDRIGRYRVSVASLALYAAVVLAMQALRPGWLEPLGAAFGLAHGFFFPAYSALIVERARPEERGKLMALSNAAFSGGFGVSGLLLGAIAERSGYPRVYLVAGMITLAGVALLLATAPRKAERPAFVAANRPDDGI